jgi:ATP-dependent exoDNAse (exonuclease V) beta subunit
MTQLAAEALLDPATQTPTLALEVLDSGAVRHGRPSGKRFGVLMHALFEHAALADGVHETSADLSAIARFLGRSSGATPEEQTRAVADVQLALRHPLFTRIVSAQRRGELYREAPVTVCSGVRELREGAVDLLFREPTGDGSQLVVVDFKTDVELSDLTLYRHQLALYADALQRALGERVSCVLFRV